MRFLILVLYFSWLQAEAAGKPVCQAGGSACNAGCVAGGFKSGACGVDNGCTKCLCN